MYIITINHKDVGPTDYKVYKQKEADEKGIQYDHWKEGKEGDYASSDDGVVARIIKRKTYKTQGKSMDYIRFAWGYTFYNPNYTGKPLCAMGRKTNTTLTGKSYIEVHKNSDIMQDLARLYARPGVGRNEAIKMVLGESAKDWEKRKWKRTMKSEVFNKMVREELNKLLQDHNLTENYTLELLEETIRLAKDKKDVTNLMRAVDNLQDMHGMKEKNITKTVDTLEAHSNVQMLDDILEEEKHIKLERKTTTEDD
tara:strand:+ start:4170 stop:4931 length:762 start_codon:yes stop_codon:yes gene_type:complete